MSKHVIKLEGGAARGAKASSALLRDLLDVLVEATRRTIRLRAEGRSTASGADPDWLIQAADFEVLGFEVGSTEIVCEAKSVGEVAPDAFSQPDMFSPIDTSQSGLGLLEQTLADIQSGDLDSDSYDDKILDKLSEFRKVFAYGIESIGFRRGQGVRVKPRDLESYSDLRRSIPNPEHVRVSGLLDSLTASRRAFKLKLDDGSNVRGRFEEDQLDRFKELWNQQVVIVGQAEFKPSGSVRHVEVDRITAASEGDRIFSKLPQSSQTELTPQELRHPQASGRGLAALVGQWPGDETDEEVDSELRKLS